MTLNYAQLIDGISLSVDPAAPANSVNLDGSGRLLMGTSSVLTGTPTGANINLASASQFGPQFRMSGTHDSADASFIIIDRARDSSVVQSGDAIMSLNCRGFDGTDYLTLTRIAAEVDGTPGANDMPGRLVFSTTADGSALPTERMRITSDGYFRLASGASGIQFNGDIAAANALDDYEEGSWTPRWQLAGVNAGGTYDANLTGGWYIKVGAIVHAWGRVAYNVNGTSTSGALRMSGLPFQMGFAATGVSITPMTACTLWFNRTNTQVPGLIAGRIDGTGTTVDLMDQDSAGQQNILDGSAVLQGSLANEFAMYICYSTSL